ncbi:MAG: sorbosone dehydrogenase family protein [Deltaproteobacteria bacterium]|nr:sorbosone dehydrogenase family protein [Deltaproteobacteria bacterium]
MRIISYRLAFFFLFLLFSISSPAFSEELRIETKTVKLIVPQKFNKKPFNTERTLTAPKGFRISVFAAGLGNVRFMAVDSEGFIYASVPDEGKVLVLPDKDKDGVADSVIIFAKGLSRPHGLAFRGRDLIVAETNKLTLLRDDNGDLKAEVKKVITEEIPGGGGHWTRTVVIGPDKKLYVSAGSSCNACIESDQRRAAILRFPEGDIFAKGLRNSVGIAFHPDSGELWTVDNGRDMLGDEIPPEELNKVLEGGDYGWPYCYGDRVPDPEFGSPERCKETLAPVIKMQAHSAPLGMAFGYGLDFPQEYKKMLYVAFHGSWNRTIPTGYKLVGIPFKNGKPSGEVVDIITGWMKDGDVWGRPVAPLVGKDGALYLSDDSAGAIYKISRNEQNSKKNR